METTVVTPQSDPSRGKTRTWDLKNLEAVKRSEAVFWKITAHLHPQQDSAKGRLSCRANLTDD